MGILPMSLELFLPMESFTQRKKQFTNIVMRPQEQEIAASRVGASISSAR